jgi:hypothetical protein
VLAVVGLVLIGDSRSASAGDPIVGSCTPELVHSLFPGTIDAAGSGVGTVAVLQYTDASGVTQPTTTATVRWTARAIVNAPGSTGAAPQIGGGLDLVMTTGAGQQLSFRATCIAGSGAVPSGVVVYANGLTTDWPGSTGGRRSFVHFEAWTDHGRQYAYVALIDGVDCALNFNVDLVTRKPYAVGTGVFSGLPAHAVYSETDCAHRFGDPFPRSLAPGLNLP